MRFQDQSKSGRYPARVISHTTGADLVEYPHLLSPETRASLEEHLKKLKPIGKRGRRLLKGKSAFQEAVRSRANDRCEECGSPGYECHHMITRPHLSEEQFWDERLGVLLCGRHHDHRAGFGDLWRLLAKKRPDDIKWMREVCPLVVNKYLPLQEVNGSS